MSSSEYHLMIDETLARVTLTTQSLKGAKAGLAELKRRKKLVSLRRRGKMANLRENRSSYWDS